MNIVQRAFARSFDRVYHALKPKQPHTALLERDEFDGKLYSIEAFYAYTKAYFDNPCLFYKDFGTPNTLNLRDGVHPNQHQWQRYWVPARTMVFDSPIKTPWAENNLTPFRWYRRKQELSKVLLLFVPGWGRTNQGIEELMCAQLRRHGIDTGLITKPYHQARTPKGAYSGEHFISANIFWTVANFRQLVSELRLLVQYMRDHYEHIGLLGMSSGGFQSCLTANCEDVEFLFPFMTGSPNGSITWHGIATQHIRRELVKRGIDEAALNKAWSIIDPGVLAHNCRAKHLKHYITIYDQLVATEYQYRLWEALGRADKLELPAAHYSGGLMALRVVSDIANFVQERIELAR